MPEQDYDYRGMIVTYWDLLRGDTSKWSSRPYFLQIIRESGEPALDVACGTGRLLLDYIQEGVDIDGVDISPEMIAKARENATTAGLQPVLYGQPMQTLDIPRRYQTIIVPSSSFLHLTWHTVHEALDLVREAGFSEVKAHANFQFVPATEDETSYIVLGKRSPA